MHFFEELQQGDEIGFANMSPKTQHNPKQWLSRGGNAVAKADLSGAKVMAAVLWGC